MDYILIASVVWVIFLLSNVAVGFFMYQLGLHGQLRKWNNKFNHDDPDEIMDKVSQSLGYVPGSEYNPFETQPLPRYKYFSMEDQEREMDEDVDYGFAPDPVRPKGGEEEDGEGER